MIQRSLIYIFFASWILVIHACNFIKGPGYRDELFLITEKVSTYYDLNQPGEKYFLPYVLTEISGMFFEPPSSIFTVQDEDGVLFKYNLESRKIVSSIKFHKPGDFEGVEKVDDMIYVLESDGDLHFFPYTELDHYQSDKIETKLESKNDTEGLGYDPKTKRLLIACKEKSELGKAEHKDDRAVYQFDIETKNLIEEPLFLISTEDLKAFFEEHKDISYDIERIRFKPSAIAYNPVDDYFYILASIGKLLIVLNREGEIMASYAIPPSLLSQPEGICFSPRGDMYISSEGEGDRGYILKYPMKIK